jgi:hypothetical protein
MYQCIKYNICYKLSLPCQRRTGRLEIAIICIIGDMQGGDKILCTATSYSNRMSPLCHNKCNVRDNQYGVPFVECKCMSMNKTIQLVADNNVAALHLINQ